MFESFSLFGNKNTDKTSATARAQSKSKTETVEPEMHGPELEALMQKIADKPGETRYPSLIALYKLLLSSILLTPLPPGSTLEQITQDGVNLVTLENNRGERGMPVFTSTDAMSLWVTEPTEYVGIPFSSLCTYALQAQLDFLLVNVSGPAGGELSHYEMTYLAEGMIPPPQVERHREIFIQKDTSVHVAPLMVLSPILQERLLGVFSQKQDRIQEAFCFQVAFADGPMKPAIAVQMPAGTEETWETEVWPDILVVLQEVLDAKDYVDIFVLNQSPQLASTIKQVARPIFPA